MRELDRDISSELTGVRQIACCSAVDVQERQRPLSCQLLRQSKGWRAKPQSQGEGSASWKLVGLVLTLAGARLSPLTWSERGYYPTPGPVENYIVGFSPPRSKKGPILKSLPAYFNQSYFKATGVDHDSDTVPCSLCLHRATDMVGKSSAHRKIDYTSPHRHLRVQGPPTNQ
jgi:hypothetical protein